MTQVFIVSQNIKHLALSVLMCGSSKSHFTNIIGNLGWYQHHYHCMSKQFMMIIYFQFLTVPSLLP